MSDCDNSGMNVKAMNVKAMNVIDDVTVDRKTIELCQLLIRQWCMNIIFRWPKTITDFEL